MSQNGKIAQREDIRDLILDSVDVLFARYGYKKMTMDDLAQHVGIGKGTLYLHFSGKEDVALSHIDRIVERLEKELRAIASRDVSPARRIEQMLLTRVLFRFDIVSKYERSLNDLLSSIRTELLERHESHFRKEASVFVSVLEEGRDSGKFSFRDAPATARALITATNALLPYSLSPRELGRRKEIEQQVLEVAQVLLHGLNRH